MRQESHEKNQKETVLLAHLLWLRLIESSEELLTKLVVQLLSQFCLILAQAHGLYGIVPCVDRGLQRGLEMVLFTDTKAGMFTK